MTVQDPPADGASSVRREPEIDFAGDPNVVAAVAEANRLAYAHLFNEAFAAEISSIAPLPHQRIAVYEHMLPQSPLRFLLADDAGAGKTIMTGLYLRAVLARRVVGRVLVVPPAGLIGNWERELRTLFRLRFRIVRGEDARFGNPFVGKGSDRVIVSIDTLVGERMFVRLGESAVSGHTAPYHLVVFDEAHKLSADRNSNGTFRKTARYRLAEALAGLPATKERWNLGWSARNLLLLGATPHMGRDFPYYCLWRLLKPSVFPSFDAFQETSQAECKPYLIRRTKEEMVRFDGQPIYPQQKCDTLSYGLSDAEQRLYDLTTDYIAETYNRARDLNSSAAQLAMSVFQRRLASSSYALMRSFERRLERVDQAIELDRSGRPEDLEKHQLRIAKMRDYFDLYTADEEKTQAREREENEKYEDDALGGFVSVTLSALNRERAEVMGLLVQAQELSDDGQDSKFEKLRSVIQGPRFSGEKIIVFTEHKDTANFIIIRLDNLGFTGRVASNHCGMDYRRREAAVEFFRRPSNEGGADYLVATDAAGEGINLQFRWIMVNYDIPWNPARLEQRMGWIHRYGQEMDPVVIINLIAGQTREGRVLKTILDKLELIRRQLDSENVFDVVGRIFTDVSLKAYLEKATPLQGTDEAIEGIDGILTEGQVQEHIEQERALFGGGDVGSRLSELRDSMEKEQYRHLLPGHLRRFIEIATPLLDLRLENGQDGEFRFESLKESAMERLRGALASYPESLRRRLTVDRPEAGRAIWMHPGEQVFDAVSRALLDRYSYEALRGAVFADPHGTVPYILHLGHVSAVRKQSGAELQAVTEGGFAQSHCDRTDIVEARLVGLRQSSDGTITRCRPEYVLRLRTLANAAPGRYEIAWGVSELNRVAQKCLEREELSGLVERHRESVRASLGDRRRKITRGYNLQEAELAERRVGLTKQARSGDSDAQAGLVRLRSEQRRLAAERAMRLRALDREPSMIEQGESVMVTHLLVVPSNDTEERRWRDDKIEAIAMRGARREEESAGATVHDVSRPELAREHGLQDWPGFDLQSERLARGNRLAEIRSIEVKGRSGSGAVELSTNEWTSACNLRNRYWLYVVFDCARQEPDLVKVQDPFGKLLASASGTIVIPSSAIREAAYE